MNIILASASPRRKEILENTNIKFDIISSSIEELVLDGESPCQMVMRLAFEKGIDIASKHKSDLVISADTIVVLDDNVLACKDWRKVFEELIATGKKFQFKQGCDERLLTD